MPDGPLLVCIGNVTIDEAVQPDGARSVAAGGDALYAALAARAEIDRVGWLAPVGDDLPDGLLDDLAAEGVVAAAPVRRALPTVRNVVVYDAAGDRTWRLVHGQEHFEAMSVHPADVPDPVLGADGVLVCGMAPEAQVALTRWLGERGAGLLYLDLQEDALAGREDDWLAVLRGCDVFLPSEVEAVALAGTADLPRAMRLFRDHGPATVVVKRGERGCLVLEPGSDTPVAVPAEPAAPRDTTGAGDAFCGAFAAVHLLGRGAIAAARAGASAARAAIAAPGMTGLLGRAGTRGAAG